MAASCVRAAALLVSLLAPGGAALKSARGTGEEGVPQDCKCLNWMKVYKQRGVACGQGLERGVFSTQPLKLIAVNMTSTAFKEFEQVGSPIAGSDYRAVCRYAYRRMNHSFAMQPYQISETRDVPESWCYVSSRCTDLRGGKNVPGTSTSVKFNGVGENLALRDQSFEKIMSIAESNLVDMSGMLRAGGFVKTSAQYDLRRLSEGDVAWAQKQLKPVLLRTGDGSGPETYIHGPKSVKLKKGLWPNSAGGEVFEFKFDGRTGRKQE